MAAPHESTAPTDGALAAAYRDQRVDAAFAELVRRYQKRAFRVLFGLVGDASLAEELAQQTFVKAALRIDQLKDPQAFYSWILSTARTTALDELRKLTRQHRDFFGKRRSRLSGGEEASSDDPAEKRTVHQVLAQLSSEDRMALVLSDLQGLSSKEVAQALEVKLSAAKMRIKRARERFRELYLAIT